MQALLDSVSVVAGVAFTKHLIHLHANNGLNDLHQQFTLFAFRLNVVFMLY